MKVFALLFVTILSFTAIAETSVVGEMKPGALAEALAFAMKAEKIEIQSLRRSYSVLAYMSWSISETARFKIKFNATSENKQFELSCTLRELSGVEGTSQIYKDWIEIDENDCTITFYGQAASSARMIFAGFTVNQNPGEPKLVFIPRASLVLFQRHFDQEHPRHGLL